MPRMLTRIGIALFTHHKYRKSIESQPSNGLHGEAGLESGYIPVQSAVELDVRETGEHGSSEQQVSARSQRSHDVVFLFWRTCSRGLCQSYPISHHYTLCRSVPVWAMLFRADRRITCHFSRVFPSPLVLSMSGFEAH